MINADVRRWREDWYLWHAKRGSWLAKSPEWMDAELGRWIERAGVPLTSAAVGNVKTAVRSKTFLDDGVRPPCWTGESLKRLADAGRAGHVFVTFENGVLDLDHWISTGLLGESLLPHSPDFWTQCALPYAFDPDAQCPDFTQALAQWQPNPDGQLLLQAWAGYCFVPGHPEQKFLLNLGPGGDGKSQWATVLAALVGAVNVAWVGLEAFDPRKDFGLEPLLGAVLNITPDANDLDRVGEGVLKAIVGGDAVTVNRKHKRAIHEPLPCKFMMNANQLPPFRDRSEGIWRRMLLLHWEPVPEAKRVRDFGARIVASEVPGIFNWAVRGYESVRANGFSVPKAGMVQQNISDARSEAQKERQFFDERVGYDAEEKVVTAKSDIYVAYEGHCKENGVRATLYGDNLIKALLAYLAEKHPEHAKKIKACSVQRRVVEADEGTRKKRFYKGIYLLRDGGDDTLPGTA